MLQATLIAGLRSGDRRALARALSVIEQEQPGAETLRASLRAAAGRAHVVGVTGPPGAGKSTLVHALLGAWLRAGQRIAVLAVDPSSPLTGGAVLGDRVRMGEHGAHPDVFIRSVASRGHPGGLSASTAALVDAMDAAGFGIVIVETVGAGQSEVDIMRLADTRLVACPPGLGDGVQAIKAGILEIADVLVVTKADQPGAEGTARDLRDMLGLRARPDAGGWTVPVLPVQAPRGEGVEALVAQLGAHGRWRGVGRRLVEAGATQAATAPMPSASAPQADGARGRVERLAAADAYVQASGFRLVSGGPGHASLRVRIEPRHLNFNGACHGGLIFSLADTAFGLASNAYGTVAVGIDAHITYQTAARLGDELLATASEVSRSRRLAVYRVDVVRAADGRPVSSFTGTVFIQEGREPPPTAGL